MSETLLPMRKLTGQDLFTLLSLFGQIGIDELIGDLMDEVDVDGEKVNSSDIDIDVSGLVTQLVQLVTKNVPKIKDELNEFLADLLGYSVDEVKELSLTDYFQVVVDVFKQEEMKDFLTLVQSSLLTAEETE